MSSRNRQNSFYYSSGKFGIRTRKSYTKHIRDYQRNNVHYANGDSSKTQILRPVFSRFKPLDLGDLLSDSQIQEIVANIKRRAA